MAPLLKSVLNVNAFRLARPARDRQVGDLTPKTLRTRVQTRLMPFTLAAVHGAAAEIRPERECVPPRATGTRSAGRRPDAEDPADSSSDSADAFHSCRCPWRRC